MATFTEDWTRTTTESAHTAQEAARRYMEESAALGRAFVNAWTSSVQVGTKAAFLQQSAMIQATQAMADTMAQANHDWLEQTAIWVRAVQDSTARLVNAGAEMVGSVIPSSQS